ncbi:MAG TPA: flagellar hook-associated protein FlgL, partial [Thermaerobacter sp.]
MRITGGMMITGLLRDLRRAQEALSTFQNRLASGKRVQRPSDDPVATVESMRLRARIAEVERMRKNAEDARDWLEATDAALDHATQILQRARELAVRAASGSLPDSSLEAVRAEVEELHSHLLEVANTTLGGNYIFSGLAINTPAYSLDSTQANGARFDGMPGFIEREVAPGVRMTINVLGDQAFDSGFTALHNLITDLQNRDTAAISQSRIAELDGAIDQVLRLRAEVGAKVNRIELGLNRMTEIRIDSERLLSEVEDV